MKKITTFIFLTCIAFLSSAQTRLDISQTNPLSSILSYNMSYILQAQKLLNFHHEFTQKQFSGSPTMSYLQLDDIRGAKVSIISNVTMLLSKNEISKFDNQQLQYIINAEKTTELITNSCINVKKFINQEPFKINNILNSNLELNLNITLKDGYIIHMKYSC